MKRFLAVAAVGILASIAFADDKPPSEPTPVMDPAKTTLAHAVGAQASR